MRLGGPLFQKYDSPGSWVAAVKAAGYRAAYCPLRTDADADEEAIRSYAAAARAADIMIAEVGAWCNPLAPDAAAQKAAIENCKKALHLADRIGARCCVNIAGSRGTKWDGPCADDLTDGTFALIVESVRDIIDTVKPARACYTLETMPWMYPDSADSYLALIKAINRPAFAVHFDPVNLICSPQLYFRTGAVIRDFVSKLGPMIKSCHAKDILLADRLTVHLDEVRPGCGGLDYATYLRELAQLPGDIPVMLEHLPDEDEYTQAAVHIHKIAREEGIEL